MAEIYCPEKAPERRCELSGGWWLYRVLKASKTHQALSWLVTRVEPDIRRVFEDSTGSSFRLVIEAPDGVQVLREELLTEWR